ncbi:MAG: branched-chain amino acid ABC transporter substrate-binding protein [Desulfobacterales bacterium]
MKKVLLLAVIIGLFAAGPVLAADTVKIGLMAPLTGAWASEGQDMKQIVELLADELNAAGGINGMKVDVITEDDGGDPRTAALASQRLSTQEIVAVIGTYGSAVTEASQGIYDEAGIIQVANGSTAIRLTEKGLDYFLRTCPRDDEQGLVAYKALKDGGYKAIAILHDNSSYAKGLADEAKALLEKDGANIVFYEALTPKENDYTAILTKMKSANPDVVFFTGYYGEAGLLLRQKMEMNWKVPFIGGDATNNPDLVKIAGVEAAKGYRFLSPPVPQDLDTPEATAFMEAYRKKYNTEPGSVWAVLAGDGFRVVTEAVKATGTTDAEKMVAFLKNNLKEFPGLTGQISFDEKGDRVGDLYRVYEVDANGKFVLQP